MNKLIPVRNKKIYMSISENLSFRNGKNFGLNSFRKQHGSRIAKVFFLNKGQQ
jgi:hypothetical protein